MDLRILDELRQVTDRVSTGDYEALLASDQLGRLTVEDIVQAVDEYPGEISKPPVSSFAKPDVVQINMAAIETYSIWYRLWYDGEEGDLALDLEIEFRPDGSVQSSIQNIWVP